MDAKVQSRLKEMGTTAAVLNAIALLKSQMDSKNYADASAQEALVGYWLGRLWFQVPASQKLNYAKPLVSNLALENRLGQPPDRVKKFLQEFNFTGTDTTHGTSIQHFQSDSPASSPTAVRQGC